MYYLHKADETEAGEKLRNFLRQDSSDMLLLALHITSVIPPQPSSERARNHNAYPGAPIWRFCRVWLEHSSRQGARNRVKQSFPSSEELFLSSEFGICLASVLGSFPEARPGLFNSKRKAWLLHWERFALVLGETPKAHICIFSCLERSPKNWPLPNFSIGSPFYWNGLPRSLKLQKTASRSSHGEVLTMVTVCV